MYRVPECTAEGAAELLALLTGRPPGQAPGPRPGPASPPADGLMTGTAVRMDVRGGTEEMRDALVRSLTGPAVTAGALVRVITDGGEVAGALIVTSTGDSQNLVSKGVSALYHRVRATTALTSPLRVRVGIDGGRLGPVADGETVETAGRLVGCGAARRMHRAHRADLIVAASADYYLNVASDGRELFPEPTSFAEWPQEGADGPTCHIAVPGFGMCPHLPDEPSARHEPQPEPTFSGPRIAVTDSENVRVATMGDCGTVVFGDVHRWDRP